jgi:hypothetical protein
MTSNAVESVKDRVASMNTKTEKSQKASDTKQAKKAKAIIDTKEESDEPAKGQKATKSTKSMKKPKSPKVTTKNKTDEDGMVGDSKTVTSDEVLEDLNDSRLLDEISLPEEPHDIEEGSNLTKEKPKAKMITMIDIAREKAKEVIDASFHLFIAQAILFFQLRNCQISETVIVDIYKYGNATISDIYDCDVAFELSNIDRDFMIALGIATYSLILGMIVVFHAMLMRDKGEPNIQNIFNLTDRIPIIDCLIEIPLCLCEAPFVTLFLWAMDIACCVGLISLVIEYGKAKHEDGNTSAFILTAFLVSYDLYRLTGDVVQYYVINKAAIYEALKKKKEKIERLLGDKSKTSYNKVDEVVQGPEEGSCSLISE